MHRPYELVLLIEETHSEIRSKVDLDRGAVIREELSAKGFCQDRGIKYRPLTEDLKKLKLFEKKGKNGEPTSVTLGDFGPICIVKLRQGELANSFTHHDFGKPLKLSWESLASLSEIFGGQKDTEHE